jgi:predicted O-methyltransferase YrrM
VVLFYKNEFLSDDNKMIDPEGNIKTIEQVERVKPAVYAEIGCYLGYTTQKVAQVLDPHSTIYIFDFERNIEITKHKIEQYPITVIGCANSGRTFDSYCWSLMNLIEENKEPIFDYVFIDGNHTWFTDGFAFLLVDKLLKVGGYVDFDDYNWTYKNSPTKNPIIFPKTLQSFTEEQIAVAHVSKIVDLLVKRNDNYQEVIANKVYKKIKK